MLATLSCLSVISSNSYAYEILNNGTRYNLSVVNGFMANQQLLQSQVWWGNSSLALSFANSAKASGHLATWTRFAYQYVVDNQWQGGAGVNYYTANPCCSSSAGVINITSANLMDWAIVTLLGPSSIDTQSSLSRAATRLRATYNKASESSNFPTSNTYDCNLFDVKGMCVSAGGRYTSTDDSHSTAAVVVLGYKISDTLRIGGFLDQSINNGAPAGIKLSNKNPMMGAFVYWNQNADGLGYQVKLANTYQDKDMTLTRDVIGTSESGTGKTGLTTESYVGELSYAFLSNEDKTLVRPYLGLRYTFIEQDGYTETGVTTPLTYSALKDETTAALIGVKFKHQLTEKTTLTGSLGLEQDLHHKAGNFTATGLSGLTAENFSGDLHRTRGLASLGAYYNVTQSQRISGEVMLQELPFQNSLGATAYVNYMIGF